MPRLQARRQIGRVADGGVVHLHVVADRADDDGAGVNADACVQGGLTGGDESLVEAGKCLVDAQSGPDGAHRSIFASDRRAEERHHAVAGELVDHAFEAVDLAEGQGDVLFEQLAVFFGVEALGDSG